MLVPCSHCINEIDTSLNLDQLVDHTEHTISSADKHCCFTNIHCPSTNTTPDYSSDDEFEEEDFESIGMTYHIPVPKMPAPELPDNMTPITIMLCKTIGLCNSSRLLRVLIDSGTTTTMIHRRVVPRDAQPKALKSERPVNTLGGTIQVKEVVTLRDIKLPEFDKNRNIDGTKALVFDSKCSYDVLLGADMLKKLGMKLDYENGFTEWLGNTVPMRNPFTTTTDDYNHMLDPYFLQEEEELLEYYDYMDAYISSGCDVSYASEILDAKYDQVDIEDVIREQNHLNDEQKQGLRELLNGYTKLFDGSLGVYPHKKVHIEVEPDAQPVHARAYPVPNIHQQAFKKELMHLVKIGVLTYAGVSDWCSPTFITPKKDGRVRWVSDLRALNKVIRRKQYPLPRINDILRKRSGYKYFTKLDISMQYYTFELDEESQDLCTIATPFGKFKYLRLPMGLKCSPDIAQSVMEEVMRGLDETDTYIDDIGVFSNNYESHLKSLQTVLTRLQDNGFTINPLKCEWCVQETDWLGYWLTPEGLKPWKKKVDAILQMQRPTNIKGLRTFLGAVNYYKDMWPSRAHVLKPLTDMTGKKKFEWTDEMDESFKKMKAILCMDAMSAYPDHNKPFHIYTDASDYQMGSVIMQDNRPVAYFSRKLNSAQKNYTTMEKELLSIVMTLKEFRTMLLGAEIHIHTDHKNLTFTNLNTQRVLRWRMYVEEYSPTLHYVPGPQNILADALSRVPKSGTEDQGTAQPELDVESFAAAAESFATCLDDAEQHKTNFEFCYHFTRIPVSEDSVMVGKSTIEENHHSFHTEWLTPSVEVPSTVRDDGERHDRKVSHTSIFDDPELVDCFLNLPPEADGLESPLRWEYVAEMQATDEELQELIQRSPQQYHIRTIQDQNIVCYTKLGDNNNTQWKIALPRNMIPQTLTFYHSVLGHPGSRRLRDTLKARYFHPQLRSYCENYHCDICQREKLPGPGYGFLPERELNAEPWSEVAVDLIGPWKIEVNNIEVELNALTCIDTTTNLVELIRIDKKEMGHIRDKFTQAWLCRYPLPQRCVHDNGKEFVGYEFQRRLEILGIKDVPTTSRNPQSNAVCERMHQTVGNILRTMLKSNPPQNLQEANDILDAALSTVMHALRSNISTALNGSPGALTFNRDMFVNIPLIADWHLITTNREQFVNESLRRSNAKRRRYDYTPGMRVLKKLHKPTKLGDRTSGPYNITQVHVNGTVTILLRPGVTERINIRRVIPYRT